VRQRSSGEALRAATELLVAVAPHRFHTAPAGSGRDQGVGGQFWLGRQGLPAGAVPSPDDLCARRQPAKSSAGAGRHTVRAQFPLLGRNMLTRAREIISFCRNAGEALPASREGTGDQPDGLDASSAARAVRLQAKARWAAATRQGRDWPRGCPLDCKQLQTLGCHAAARPLIAPPLLHPSGCRGALAERATGANLPTSYFP